MESNEAAFKSELDTARRTFSTSEAALKNELDAVRRSSTNNEAALKSELGSTRKSMEEQVHRWWGGGVCVGGSTMEDQQVGVGGQQHAGPPHEHATKSSTLSMFTAFIKPVGFQGRGTN